jgi:metal-responsive CopG/Arc/MetJ family transcriptional regulator
MSIQHRRNQRVPVDLPPLLLDHLESTAKQLAINRTQLIRQLVIYGLNQLKSAESKEKFVMNLYSLEAPLSINNLISESK